MLKTHCPTMDFGFLTEMEKRRIYYAVILGLIARLKRSAAKCMI